MRSYIQEDDKFIEARINMVQNQIVPNNVTDEKILHSLYSVPKQLFVNESLTDVAYSESSIAVGFGRYLLEPVVFDKMINAAAIRSNDNVLDVACGFGYSSVVMASLASHVVCVENEQHLITQAKYLFGKLNIKNCIVHSGELLYGYPDAAPYDVIFINGALSKVSPVILEQLAQGGRCVLIEEGQGLPHLVLYTNTYDGITRDEIGYFSAKRL